MIKRTTLLFISVILSLLSFAQPASVRIEVLSGGNLSFVFNSIAKYKNGITSPANYTTVGITVDEGGAATDYLRWELTVEAEDADADGFINGTDPANTLPFSTVEISSATVQGCVPCQHFFPGGPNLILSNVPQVLVDGDQAAGVDDIPPNLSFTNDKIGITYYVGTSTPLLGAAPDFYSDVLLITLTMYDF